MTPEEIQHRCDYLRREMQEYEPYGLMTPTILRYGLDLAKEVDRLNSELTEARLTAEEAWDAHDYAIEREKKK